MYEREEFFDKLEAYLESVGAGAYATYELSGEFDILLRVWLPQAQATGRFADNIEGELGLADSCEFQVVDIIRHWVWSGEASHVPEGCDCEELRGALDVDGVEMINRLSDESHRADAANPSPAEEALAQRLMSAHALTDLRGTTGIRLLVRLGGSPNLKREDRLAAASLVAKELDRITRPKGRRRARDENGGFTVDEVSLYRCRDHSLLLLCRVPYVSWHSIRDDLLKPLAALPGISQTTTFPALTRNFVRSRERLQLVPEVSKLLGEVAREGDSSGGKGGTREDGGGPSGPLPPPPTLPGVHEFLDRAEDASFEAKGSAFTRLEPWLSREIEAPEEKCLEESNGFFRDTIVKSIVAMLNSGGGVILIGVLERERYDSHESDRLRLRLSRVPRGGRFYVIGLQDPTFQQGGWDRFELKFHRLLKELIAGEVADLVHVSRDRYKKQTLAVVRIGYAGIGDGYYLREGGKSRFVIRRGGSTDELDGAEIHRYIERRRRLDRRD